MNYPLLSNQMPKRIKSVWKKNNLLTYLIALLVELIAASVCWYFEWTSKMIVMLMIGLFVAITLASLIEYLLIPYRYAFHRYEITEEDFALQKGYFFRSTTYVPFNRIQHIQTNQGPFLRKEQLMQLNIHTAATVHKLSGLDMADAQRLRQQLISLVKVAKEDV